MSADDIIFIIIFQYIAAAIGYFHLKVDSSHITANRILAFGTVGLISSFLSTMWYAPFLYYIGYSIIGFLLTVAVISMATFSFDIKNIKLINYTISGLASIIFIIAVLINEGLITPSPLPDSIQIRYIQLITYCGSIAAFPLIGKLIHIAFAKIRSKITKNDYARSTHTGAICGSAFAVVGLLGSFFA